MIQHPSSGDAFLFLKFDGQMAGVYEAKTVFIFYSAYF